MPYDISLQNDNWPNYVHSLLYIHMLYNISIDIGLCTVWHILNSYPFVFICLGTSVNRITNSYVEIADFFSTQYLNSTFRWLNLWLSLWLCLCHPVSVSVSISVSFSDLVCYSVHESVYDSVSDSDSAIWFIADVISHWILCIYMYTFILYSMLMDITIILYRYILYIYISIMLSCISLLII